MLAAKVVGAIAFVWIIGAVLGALYEMEWSKLEDTVAMLNPLTWYEIVTTEGVWGELGLVKATGDFFGNIWNLATFNFSFITGEWTLVWMIVFVPLTVMVVYGIVMTIIGLVRGTLGGS